MHKAVDFGSDNASSFTRRMSYKALSARFKTERLKLLLKPSNKPHKFYDPTQIHKTDPLHRSHQSSISSNSCPCQGPTAPSSNIPSPLPSVKSHHAFFTLHIE
jgi:hypothetical protein